ncbi:putative regulator of nonsense transcripts [Aspergillus brunneoviolaceus CBS 621.78]|uniref:Uncharacterized protein n=1 Tax=Aspergillus brunneoviolaceus CBS 621.78 TaxID=1450534 RepID=A0ACD1FVG4_9EURO|nr:hypothetical protein BO95DRAFT_447368 [Aspergillus brunneoviolaceus CBS 621.78]RAH40991.1 hypothetical protein BO95DRAFT_447368 [Aspergillus brunneoviolaceus CBS 621.78]
MAAPVDERIAADLDESHQFRPRRHDDDDEGSDHLGDDDAESTASATVAERKNNEGHFDEEKELPPHACSYVS